MPQKITFPSSFSRSQIIGVTAPSSGLSAPAHKARLDLIISQMNKRGIKVIEGKCLRNDVKHVSGSAQERADDFLDLWNNNEVSAIVPPWGGELLIEILERIDFERLAKSSNPKWVLGYSDTATLLFPLTLMTGIASAHGSNLMDLIENQVFGVTEAYLKYLSTPPGGSFSQTSFPKFQTQWTKYEENLEAKFNVEHDVRWKSLKNNKQESMRGRLIGGCLDTLIHLIGTPYGDLPQFIREFKNDGTILYFENCELSPVSVARSLIQMKYAGWFKNINGLLIGRSAAAIGNNPNSLQYVEALHSVLGGFDFPILFDVDIGHQPPQLLLINGAKAEIDFADDAAKIVQTLL